MEAFKAVLRQELHDDQQTLEDIQGKIVQYIESYFYRVYLYQLVEINKRTNDIYHEDYVFLSNQIKLIDNEIEILRTRQNELTAFTKVDDIIHLATLTGYDLNFSAADDAKQLLGKISDALERYSGEDRVEKYALLRLKTIIQERSDYLPTINYISWVIKLKRQFKKQLSNKRSQVKKEQTVLRDERASIKSEIQILTDSMEILAEKVRYYWAKPITYINADICYAYRELKEERERLRNDAPALRSERKKLNERKRSAITEIRDKRNERNDVGDKIRSMRGSHSSDRWEWDSLQSEYRSLSSDIESLSRDIDRYSSRIKSLTSEIEALESAVKTTENVISLKKEERKRWGEKRTHIVKIIKQYDKNFRSDRKTSSNDEINIIVCRLGEIQQIREAGVVEAQKVYKQEYEEIISAHEEKVSEFNARMQLLQTRLHNAESECSKHIQRVSAAEKRLEFCKEADNRITLLKMFSESPAVMEAEEDLKKARAVLVKAEEDKKAIVSMIDELEKASNTEIEVFNEQIKNCKPRYLRPTGEEQDEEMKLLLRHEEIIQQRKEGGNESKN